MAQRTFSAEKTAKIRSRILEGKTYAETARLEGCSTGYVSILAAKMRANPDIPDAPPQPRRGKKTAEFPSPEIGDDFPTSLSRPRPTLQINDAGWWLIIGDTHNPYHDETTIRLAFAEAKDKGCVGVLLNGDIADMFDIAPYFRKPTKERFNDEIQSVRSLLGWARKQLPDARFVYRAGNHEERFARYVIERAPALWDSPEIRLPKLLDLDSHGIEWIEDKRKIRLGFLNTLHGHEFKQALGNVVSPARTAFLRGTANVIVSHHHRSSFHPIRTLDDEAIATWSIGCACHISPDYDPYNQWNHGYALVELMSDGWFSVLNRHVLKGRVV